jgi:hypothetical protein
MVYVQENINISQAFLSPMNEFMVGTLDFLDEPKKDKSNVPLT